MFVVYTRYKNSLPATLMSAIGSALMMAGVFWGASVVGQAVATSGPVDMEEVVGQFVCAAIFVAVGFLLTRGAKKISENKLKKEIEKMAAGTEKAAAGESEALYTASDICRNCGNKLGPEDIFCYKCGTRRGN